ncbi:MAG: LLM class flavin-dependent oxidoreductase [Candidatus Lambdaproteobacteria bacterium]|nr:LLM class flavin-dependent oxidoreductase [Candidatus Lambdaproteobacteria bacterium]
MHVGYSAIFQNPERRLPDREVYENELRLACMAEPLGFESVWSVEHHFTDYTMCPDVVQFLSYMAGRTRTIKLGSMVVVLPWHDPVRVAEQVSMLDNLSGGRMILGIGRGVGRVEFDGFRLDMNESRETFVEYAQMVLEGLERGYVEHDGQYVKQPRRDIRPAPFKSFRGRTYAAAVSPESLPLMAKLGVGILVVPQKPWKTVEKDIVNYNTFFRAANGVDAPPPLVAGWTFVDQDEGRAQELGRKYIGDYYRSVIKHYEFNKDHLRNVKGYEFYGKGFQDKVAELGIDGVVNFLTDLMPFGTPEQVYEKIMYQHKLIGHNGFMAILSYSGMPWSEAERNMTCFAREVMPLLKQVQVPTPEFARTA